MTDDPTAVTFETVIVTPAMAREWLPLNVENNRNKKPGRIARYARDMVAGKWLLTGEAIKFRAGDGALIDGQNRLAAVVEAGVSVTMTVARGVSDDAMVVIDTGAGRTFADTLKIKGGSDRMVSGSVVRWVLMWEQGNRMQVGGVWNPTHAEMAERYDKEPDAFDAAARRGHDCARQGLGTASTHGMAHFLLTHVDHEMAAAFFDSYVSGIGLPERSPILALRNRMIRTRADRLSRQEQLALIVRAWNAYRTDRPMDRLQIGRGELDNRTFPEPK
jgi:hypothetical protein